MDFVSPCVLSTVLLLYQEPIVRVVTQNKAYRTEIYIETCVSSSCKGRRNSGVPNSASKASNLLIYHLLYKSERCPVLNEIKALLCVFSYGLTMMKICRPFNGCSISIPTLGEKYECVE